MWHFVGEAAELIAKAAGIEPRAVAEILALPPDLSMGDLAFPCFTLAREHRQSPVVLASKIARMIQPALPFAEAKASGPYVNLRLDRASAAQRLLNDVRKAGPEWGGSMIGRGRSVCIDYCSPNIARLMHLGHLRSMVIGESLARLHEALGYRVIRINFLGDWGTQFGKLIVGWEKWETLKPSLAIRLLNSFGSMSVFIMKPGPIRPWKTKPGLGFAALNPVRPRRWAYGAGFGKKA